MRLLRSYRRSDPPSDQSSHKAKNFQRLDDVAPKLNGTSTFQSMASVQGNEESEREEDTILLDTIKVRHDVDVERGQ